MTTQEAQECIATFIKDWCETIGPDFIEDSIRGGIDDKAIEALSLVGTDFPWSITINY